MSGAGVAAGNKAVALREPSLECDMVGTVPRARGRMDTWNAVRGITAMPLGAARPQTPRLQSPPERGLTPDGGAQKMRNAY